MSCGTKLTGRMDSWSERHDLAEKLERDGEHRLADAVKRGDCLDSSELYRAERSLERSGLSRYFDYKEERCACRTDEEPEW